MSLSSMSFTNIEKTIDTPFGPTFIKKIGQGAPLFVIHGGPGFEHDYLVPALESLTLRRTVIFYDQPGCGRSEAKAKSLSPSQTFSHFRWLSHHLSAGQKAGIIAHSWGALVFIAALTDEKLRDQPAAKFIEGLLINPVPLTSDKYALCGKNLLNRIKFLDRLKLCWLAYFEPDGAKIMKLLLPYYVVENKTLQSDTFQLNKTTYLKISQQLKSFDYSSNLSSLPSLSAIIGTEDFVSQDLVSDLIPYFSTLHIMKNTGHFPFWESPGEFNEILLSTFVQ